MRSAIIITGQIAGRVTLRNACQREAPSIAAASSCSWSTLASAASRMMNMNGVHCHTSQMMIAG